MDKYTKAVLTVIAVSLVFIAAGGEITFPPKAEAGGNGWDNLTHLEPDHKGGAFVQMGQIVYHCNINECRKIASVTFQ